MINYRLSEQNLHTANGRIIFHTDKGSDAFTSFLPQVRIQRIGARLGRVTRITGSFRVFYEAEDGTEKYLSSGGIGYLCDTEEEAQMLEKLRDNAAKQVREFSVSVYTELQSKLDDLLKT